MKDFLLINSIIIGIGVVIGLHALHNIEIKQRVLVIGVECNYAPSNWIEKYDTPSNLAVSNASGWFADGYDIQIARWVASLINAKLEVKKIDWEDLIPALMSHDIDAIFSSMLDTPDRKQLISFTETYADHVTRYLIVTHKDSGITHVAKSDDLRNISFVGQKGTVLDTVIDQLPNVIHLPPVDTTDEMVKKVHLREADCCFTDLDALKGYKLLYPELAIVDVNGADYFRTDYTGVCAGVRKTDTKLLWELNQAIQKIPYTERREIMNQAIIRSWQ